MVSNSFDQQLARAVETMGERLHADVDRQLRQLADDLSAAGSLGHEEHAGHGARWLLDAVRAMDSAQSLSQVLDALLMGASRGAARAGILLLQGQQLRGHQFVGFPASLDAGCVDLPLEGSGLVSVAIAERRPAGVSDGPPPPFAGLAPNGDGAETAAFPIALGGDVVAVLYVDQATAEPGAEAPDLALLEVLARHAARALEAMTAFKAAQSFARADTGFVSAAPPVNTGSDEDEAALRYARLVISEIKLYHEEAVAEGRRAGDLATRLGGEIARARAQYEQRVPPHFRGAAEHFQAELVRTLAGGDASLFAKASVA